MIKRIGRSRAVQTALGVILAYYLRLVAWTGRPVYEPEDPMAIAREHGPLIVAMWHGQHFLMPAVFAARKIQIHAIVSRSGDGHINAVTLKSFGIGAIRASGGQAAHHYRKRGGARGFLEAVRGLRNGISVALTADVPKGPARVCGEGIVQIARASGRPIYPIAVATRWHIDLDTWDKASINLPFGRCAVIVGDPIRVDSDADKAAVEAARQGVEEGLNKVTARAYVRAGGGA